MRAALILSLLALLSRAAAGQDAHTEIRQVANPVAPPDCITGVICLSDSTRLMSNWCCDVSSYTDWLIFPEVGDSLEFFVIAPRRRTPSLTIGKPARRRYWQEDLPGLTAPFLRQRFPEPGAYVLTADISETPLGTPYELRIKPAGTARPLHAAPLRLQLVGGDKVWYIVRPRERATSTVGSTADYSVPAGIYRVLSFGSDSLEVCRKPCRHPSMVSLDQESARVAK